MANAKVIEKKNQVVSEIKEKFNEAKSIVVFDYRGLSVSEATELRKLLRESGSDYKVYKNTLTRRALEENNKELEAFLTGPNAISFGADELSIVKVLSDYAKDHKALEIKAGIVDGKFADLEELKQYATIPSREGLLTMLAGGMMATVRDLSICLDLYSKENE